MCYNTWVSSGSKHHFSSQNPRNVDQEAVLANLARVQDDAAEQASRVLHELGSAKSELSSYMEAIEADRRY